MKKIDLYAGNINIGELTDYEKDKKTIEDAAKDISKNLKKNRKKRVIAFLPKEMKKEIDTGIKNEIFKAAAKKAILNTYKYQNLYGKLNHDRLS
jgi:hypothetical protein